MPQKTHAFIAGGQPFTFELGTHKPQIIEFALRRLPQLILGVVNLPFKCAGAKGRLPYPGQHIQFSMSKKPLFVCAGKTRESLGNIIFARAAPQALLGSFFFHAAASNLNYTEFIILYIIMPVI
jgi:hypothetical protein